MKHSHNSPICEGNENNILLGPLVTWECDSVWCESHERDVESFILLLITNFINSTSTKFIQNLNKQTYQVLCNKETQM